MSFTPEQLRAMQLEKMKRVGEESYRYFEPTGKGEEFLNLVGSGDYFITLLSAANGIGKTTLSVNMLAHLFWPTGNQFFQQPLWKNWPFLKKGRIVSDPTTIKEAIIPEMKKWFPARRYTTEKMGKAFECKWKTDTGFEFDIMSFEQDVKEFESTTLGWTWLDEPPPESIFVACVSRLRRGGIMWITCTPLTGSAWVYDRIIANTENEAGRRTFIEADVYSASITKGIRGFLRDEDIENMISQYSEEDKQARIYGKFQHLTGLIFKEFSRKIHVIKPFFLNPKDYVVLNMLDPHPRNPDAVLWVAIDRKGTKFVIDELYIPVNGTEELALSIKRKDSQYRVIRHLADPSAFVCNQHEDEIENKSLADRLKKYGLAYTPATKFRVQADRRIHDALQFSQVADHMLRPPEMYVFENCQRLIWEFEHYRWQEWKGRQTDEHDPKQKPVDKDDHEIENLGRALLTETKFIELPTPSLSQASRPNTNLDPYARSS